LIGAPLKMSENDPFTVIDRLDRDREPAA